MPERHHGVRAILFSQVKAFIMKYKMMLCLCLIWLGIVDGKAQSCCATGSGCNYSVLPDLNKHMAGLRWTYSQYENRNFSLIPEQNGVKNHEMVNTLEAFARFNLPKRFQLSVFVPVTFIHQYSALSDTHDRGLGDMSVLAQYQILDPKKFGVGRVKHELRAGVGVKLPTGKYKTGKNDLYNTSVQLGSGSTDVLLSMIYSLSYRKLVMNARASYKLNTVNKYGFRFGDKAETGVRFSYVAKAGKITLMPMIGASYIYTQNNYNHHQPVYESYAHLLTANAGMEAYVKHFAFSVSVTPVVYNRVFTMAYRQLVSTEVGAFYLF